MKKLFCPVCSKLLISNEGGLKCICGYISQEIIGTEENSIKPSLKGEGFVEDKNELATFPNTCKKCGHDQAQVIELGVWFGDEAGVVRYKCGKCGYTSQDINNNT